MLSWIHTEHHADDGMAKHKQQASLEIKLHGSSIGGCNRRDTAI
jgi:hypothetical protein